MYPQEHPFPRERPRINPPPPLRLDQQFPPQPVNYHQPQSSSRSHLTDYSFVSPTYPSADRSILSIKSPSHDFGQEPIRAFRQPRGISNFAPHHGHPNMNGSSKPVKVFHSRAITQLVGRTAYPNGLTHSHAPQGFIPGHTGYGNQFAPMPSHERAHTLFERPPEHREDKVLMFLERQNAVIEKLAIRIQQEERDSIQRDKRELEQKLLDLQQEKMLRQQEDIRLFPKLIPEPTVIPKEKEEPEKPKEKKQNTLETLGKFYLMSKLMEGKKHKRSVSDPNAQRLLQNFARDKPRENSLLRDLEDEEMTPTIRSSGLLRVQSNKQHPNMLMPPMFDDGEGDGSQSRRGSHSLYRMKGASARDLRGSKVAVNRGPYTNDNSLEEEDLMEEERPVSKQRRKPIRKSKTIKTPKNSAQDEAKAKKKAQAEADALAAAEVEKSKQEKRKKEIRIKLRCFLWSINYPHCLFDDVRKKVEIRKEEIQKKMSGNIQMNFEAAQTFLLTVGEKFIKEMVLESKQLDLYHPKKSISEGDLNTRSTLIFNYLKGLFDKMIVGTNTTNISKNLFRFLCSISEDSGVLPHNFMFDFEVKRLQFTYYATLKFQTQLKSKMVIGLFILLRVLLHKMIMRPWTVIPGLKKDKVKMNNLHTIGSVLYHTVLDFFRGNVPIFPNNQNFLPSELKVKPRSIPLEAMETSPDADEQDIVAKKEEPKSKEVEPITGFLTKDQLKCFFVDRKKLYDQLKALVDGWLEKIYQLSHTIYLNTPKEERETMGIPI